MTQEVRTEIELDAPIETVWSLLADVASYGDWNRIFRFTRADARVGGRGLLWARIGPLQPPIPIRFEVFDAPQEIRWRGGTPGIINGSHYLKLERIDDKHTRLIHGEDFNGLIIRAGWPLLGKQLPGAYHAFNRALVKKLAA